MANSSPEAASVFPSVLRFLTLIYRRIEAIRANYCFLRIRRLRVRILPPVLQRLRFSEAFFIDVCHLIPAHLKYLLTFRCRNTASSGPSSYTHRMSNWRLEWTSERSLNATHYPSNAPPALNVRLASWLQQRWPDGIKTATPSRTGTHIELKSGLYSAETSLAKLASLLEAFQTTRIETGPTPPPTVHDIPVCYLPEFAPDLSKLAAHTGKGMDEIARLHSGQVYEVMSIGFLPGFAYLGQTPEVLRLPRHDSPRARVRRGSVGLAEDMTGIYPFESAGGWWLIGCCPLPIFDSAADTPTRFQVGDQVQFHPIGKDEFEMIEAAG